MMDWATHKAPKVRHAEPPAPRLIEVYWRAAGPSRKVIACGLYRTTAGLELRCGYSVDDLLRSQRIGPQDNGRYTAAGWLHIVLSNGTFDVVECAVDDELEQMRTALDFPPSGVQ